MSQLVVTTYLEAVDEPLTIGDFDFSVRDLTEREGVKLLQYYSQDTDMVVSPSMVHAFEHDVRTFVDDVIVRVEGSQREDPLVLLEPVLVMARRRYAYIVIRAVPS